MKYCKCSKCENKGKLLPLTDFNKNKHFEDGLNNRCRVCSNKSVRESTLKNYEYYLKISREYSRKDRKENPQKYRIISEKWNKINKERGYWKKHYKENKKRYQQYEKREDVRLRRNKRWRDRYKKDLDFRLRELMKSNFHLFFKDKGERKYLRFSKTVDYTYEELKIHLESYFRKGMSWDNLGELWEIHHIKPQNLFDITNPKEVRECWKLDNLIPLWKTTEISHKMGDTTIGNRNLSKTEIYSPYMDK